MVRRSDDARDKDFADVKVDDVTGAALVVGIIDEEEYIPLVGREVVRIVVGISLCDSGNEGVLAVPPRILYREGLGRSDAEEVMVAVFDSTTAEGSGSTSVEEEILEALLPRML